MEADSGRNDMNPRVKTVVLHPLVGQTLNQYRIDSLLGQGGMGVVYRAHDLKLQRPVALKLLPTELTGDQERRKRFLLEARAPPASAILPLPRFTMSTNTTGRSLLRWNWSKARRSATLSGVANSTCSERSTARSR